MSVSVQTLPKTELKGLDFARTDVLSHAHQKIKRKSMLMKAVSLGTGYEPKKSQIIFQCKSGIKKVEAKVIALEKETVTLSGLIRLPVKSIIGLKLQLEQPST